MNTYVSPDLYGIIGHPVGHSLSPLLHTTAFQALGLPGILLPWDIHPEKLGDFVQAVRTVNIHGACVTIPHKQALVPLVDTMTDRARMVGAVNTLYRDGDAIAADNTDVAGFIAPLAGAQIDASTPVLLLGAGGASRAAVVGLLHKGMKDISVTGRTGAKAHALADEFGLRAIPWEHRGTVETGLIVNTTPLGMTGALVAESPFDKQWFAGRTGIVYDTIYTPLETRLLRDAAEADWRTISGLGMFIGQAECQFTLWTGHGLPPEAKKAVVAALYGPDFDATGIPGLFG